MTEDQQQVAATDRGLVAGTARGGVVSFRGIPYAASPVGELRFAPPRPHPGWAGTRDATQPGPAVPQAASRLEQVMGHRVPDWNEDGSLTVNVHTPRQTLADGAPRPVLVWWHGGGFSSGSGGWDWYDGARLAELGDVVVVTANYRIGPLGYLWLPDIGAANLGSQDQGVLLHWVRDNIAAFGGDPRAVTVGGQSAGAYSTLSLALDPQTSGLFDRMLVQSGPFGLPPQDPATASENATTYLALLGIRDGANIAKQLRALPVEQLLSAYGQLAGGLARPGDATPPMYPVLGGPGMPRTWQQAIADGALEGKALLVGTTRDEATAFCAFDPRIQNLDQTGALNLLTNQLGDRAHDVYQRKAAQLPQATPPEVFTAIMTDELLRDDSLRIADHHAAGGNTTYVYQFDYQPVPDEHTLGTTHCAELPFLFNTFDTYPDSPMLGTTTDAAQALGHTFASAIAQFVTTGSAPDWLPYAPATPTRIRHFS